MKVNDLGAGLYQLELSGEEEIAVVVMAQDLSTGSEEIIMDLLSKTIELHKHYDADEASNKERGKNGN